MSRAAELNEELARTLDDLRALTKREKYARRGASRWEGTLPSQKQAPRHEGAPREQTAGARDRRGDGGGSPPRLDTSGKRCPSGSGSIEISASPPSGGAAGTKAKSFAPVRQRGRHRLARPVRQSESTWREQYASALQALGRRKSANAVRDCGTVARVHSCLHCGETHAAIFVSVSCDARACPHCARYSAQERRARLLPAVQRVAAAFAARRKQLLEARREEYAAARRAVQVHEENLLRALARLEREQLPEHERAAEHHARLLEKARERKRLSGLQAYQLDAQRWCWRFITLSPAWHPRLEQELTIDGLRARVEQVQARWEALYQELGSAASAVVSVELSAKGHVHLHALAWVPEYLVKEHVERVVGEGCFVDIRALKASVRRGKDGVPRVLSVEERVAKALKEGVKYACKSASPLHGAWLAGARRKLVHPELAARWTVAMAKRQLGRVYGPVLRDCLAAVEALEAQEPKPERAPACWSCGGAVEQEGRLEATAHAARQLGPFWGRAARWSRPVRDRPPDAPAPLSSGASG